MKKKKKFSTHNITNFSSISHSLVTTLLFDAISSLVPNRIPSHFINIYEHYSLMRWNKILFAVFRFFNILTKKAERERKKFKESNENNKISLYGVLIEILSRVVNISLQSDYLSTLLLLLLIFGKMTWTRVLKESLKKLIIFYKREKNVCFWDETSSRSLGCVC